MPAKQLQDQPPTGALAPRLLGRVPPEVFRFQGNGALQSVWSGCSSGFFIWQQNRR
jgi:hypothetical protein